MAKVLIVDDEPSFVKGLTLSLRQDGFTVSSASDGRAGYEAVMAEQPDIVLLDVMLPGIDGFSLCRMIREKRQTPIIMLTAKGDEVDRIVGLEIGADDYIGKPFSTRELIARMRAVLRRAGAPQAPAQPDGLHVDLDVGQVFCNGHAVSLTAKEWVLLSFLVRHARQVFTREQLLNGVWGYDFYGGERAVDVCIRRLREKIEPDPGRPRYIITHWGRGYSFVPPSSPGVSTGDSAV